jgi:hypothetical protein
MTQPKYPQLYTSAVDACTGNPLAFVPGKVEFRPIFNPLLVGGNRRRSRCRRSPSRSRRFPAYARIGPDANATRHSGHHTRGGRSAVPMHDRLRNRNRAAAFPVIYSSLESE